MDGCVGSWLRAAGLVSALLGAALLSPARGCGVRPVSAELGVAELVGAFVARPALRSAGLVFGSWQLVHCQHLSSEFVYLYQSLFLPSPYLGLWGVSHYTAA